MPDPCRIRFATPDDAGLLAVQRVAMFRDMGRTVPEIEEELRRACQDYFSRALPSGEYVGWVAEDGDGAPIAGAGVQFRPLLPRTDPAGRRLLVGREGLVLNVYVEPTHRGRGVARALMQTLLAWAPGAGIVRLVLHASDEGRPLYQSLGFAASNEMLYAAGR